MFARNTLRGVRRGILLAAIAALASTVGGLAYHELHDADHPRSQAEPSHVAPPVSGMFDHKPTLLAVGDSYAATYPELVADKMGWSLALDAQDGTGFVHRI